MTSTDTLIKTLRDNQEVLVPCLSEDVQLIERKFNVKLPAEYVKFLLAMGRSGGSFLRGSSCFYSEIFELRNWAQETLTANDFKPLPDDSFVFWMHQGYQFAFFKLSEGDNPPVYYFLEGETENEFEVKEKCLSDFFFKQIGL